MYLPLAKALPRKSLTLKNAIDDLLRAIQSGKVTYHRGRFTGQFSASVSREIKALGGEWNKGSWQIFRRELPPSVQMAIDVSMARLERELESVDSSLESISLATDIKLQDAFDKTLWKVEERFKKSLKDLVVSPSLTPSQVKRFSDEYVRQIEHPIRDWAMKEREKLRRLVRTRVFSGLRHEELAHIIQKSYGLSKAKATSIARQETRLAVVKFKEIRYQSAGLDKYKWQCVAGTLAHPVRPRHKQLHDMSARGTIFRLSDPPNTAEPGEPAFYANPGEPWNCRCVSRMLLTV